MHFKRVRNIRNMMMGHSSYFQVSRVASLYPGLRLLGDSFPIASGSDHGSTLSRMGWAISMSSAVA